MTTALKGQCLCGGVAFKATGDILRVSACYCSMCLTQNGGGAFHGAEFRGDLIITQGKGLKWYRASDKAQRGFCGGCGSSLFWISNSDEAYFDVSLGALNDTSDLQLNAHIFVESCPSYKTLPTNAPHLTEAEVLANPLQDK